MGTDKQELTHTQDDVIDALERAILCTSPGFWSADDTLEPELQSPMLPIKSLNELAAERSDLDCKATILKDQNERITRVMVSYGKRVEKLEHQLKNSKPSTTLVREAWADLVPELEELVEAGVVEALNDIDLEDEIQRMVHMVTASTDIEDLVRKELVAATENHTAEDADGDQDRLADSFGGIIGDGVARAMASDEIQELFHSEIARATRAVGLLADLDTSTSAGRKDSRTEFGEPVLTQFDLSVPSSPVTLEHVPRALVAASSARVPTTPVAKPLLNVPRHEPAVPVLERSETPNMEMHKQKQQRRAKRRQNGVMRRRGHLPPPLLVSSTRVETENGSHVITVVTADTSAGSSYSCAQPLLVTAAAPTTIAVPPTPSAGSCAGTAAGATRSGRRGAEHAGMASQDQALLPVAEVVAAGSVVAAAAAAPLDETLPYTRVAALPPPPQPATSASKKPYPHRRVAELQRALRQTETERDMALELMTRKGKRWQELVAEGLALGDGDGGGGGAGGRQAAVVAGVDEGEGEDAEDGAGEVSGDEGIVEEEIYEEEEEAGGEGSVRWSWSDLSFEGTQDDGDSDAGSLGEDEGQEGCDLATTASVRPSLQAGKGKPFLAQHRGTLRVPVFARP